MIKTVNIETKDFFKNSANSIIISNNRKNILDKIAQQIFTVLNKNNRVNINFICTHNSRRSQLGQIWSFFAVDYFNLKNIFSFSGGTEVTAFHRNTVRTLRQTGFNFNVIEFSHQNPKYLISFEDNKKSIIGFSKIYDDKENNSPFIAITTCSSTDINCPLIPETSACFHLPFVDPKFSDNTIQQQQVYLATNQQIAGEIFILFEKVKRLLS